MRILETRPVPAGNAGICRVDVELDNGVKLFGLTVKYAESGDLRVWPPKAFGQSAARLPIELAGEIASAALRSFGGNCHARRST